MSLSLRQALKEARAGWVEATLLGRISELFASSPLPPPCSDISSRPRLGLFVWDLGGGGPTACAAYLLYYSTCALDAKVCTVRYEDVLELQ